jgi:hypothetical protein
MAATNVQAFSGDVEISSNLAVNTNDLFVDTVSGSVGIGTTKPEVPFHIYTSGYLKNNYVQKFLGNGPEQAASYVLLLKNDNTPRRLIGKVFGVRGSSSVSTSFEAKLNVSVTNNGTIDARMTFEHIGASSFYCKLVTLTYDSGSYIALALLPTINFRGVSGGIYFDGKLTSGDDLQYITDLGTLSNITDYTATNQDRITFTGNIGIGSTNPGDNLSVMGTISSQNDGVNTPKIFFRSGANNTNTWKIGTNINDSYAGDFSISRLDSESPFHFIISDAGKVGVGITSGPTAKLEVYNSGTGHATADLVSDFTGSWIRVGDARTARTFTNGIGIKFHDSGVSHYSIGQKDGYFRIAVTKSDGNTLFPNTGSDRLEAITVRDNGSVGINTTLNQHTLDVAGSAGIRGYCYSRLFYSFVHQTGGIGSALNYDITGAQFTPASGSGSVDDGWYHAVAMRFDSNPFEYATYQVWYYGGFGGYGNHLSGGLTLQTAASKLRMVTDADASNFPTPYLITLHKYGGRDWP